MQGVILCGGFSTRLGDITKETPKILLKIGTKSVLEHQVELLAEAGVTRVFLASGHLHDRLVEAVGEQLHGIPIEYVREEQPLGTGGAIKNALRKVTEFPAFVLNGDILLDTSLHPMVKMLTSARTGILLGVEVPDARSYGRLIIDPNTYRIERFVEKDPQFEGAGYINGGVYLFDQSIFQYFPDLDKFSIEYDVFPHVPELYATLFQGTWIDIGTPERLEFARRHLVSTVQRSRMLP